MLASIDALADARAAMDVFEAQRAYEEKLKGKSLDELAVLSRRGRTNADPAGKLIWVEGRMCFGTKKNQGVPVGDDWGYARWMLRADHTPEATKRILAAELNRLDALATSRAAAGQPTLI